MKFVNNNAIHTDWQVAKNSVFSQVNQEFKFVTSDNEIRNANHCFPL